MPMFAHMRDELYLRWRQAALGDTTQAVRTLYPFVYTDAGSDVPYWTLSEGVTSDQRLDVGLGAAGLMGEFAALQDDAVPARALVRRLSGDECLLCGSEEPAQGVAMRLHTTSAGTHNLPVGRCPGCSLVRTVPTHTAVYLLALPKDETAVWAD